MEPLADKAWVLLLIVAAIAMLGLLHCVASCVRNATQVHDLRVRVNTLRNQQLDRLRSQQATVVDPVVEDDPAEPPQAEVTPLVTRRAA